MNFNQLLAALSQLGVTLQSDSDPKNIAGTLRRQRQYRASLYLAQLQAVRTHFLVTLNAALPNGLGVAAYQFMQTALQSSDLLNSLALALDYWVAPAVEGQFQVNNYQNLADYQNYFNNNILGANYAGNVAAFFAQYPITTNAIQRISANFQANIEEACRRIWGDLNQIRDLFIDQYPGLVLNSLKAIKSTGSDFHKGGKQVLILTFATGWWWGNVPWWSDLRVVYKPTDLEIDCLLVGNSAAVNNAVLPNPAFQAQSLVEIFNARGATLGLAGFEPLPTYRILPRNPTSNQVIGPLGLPIRNAYGYMEYLGYGLSGIQLWPTDFYLKGASDYLIYWSEYGTQIVPKFYHLMGEWLAFATMFSITDMHMENVRVTGYEPKLIDLELSLTKLFNFDVTATTMFEMAGATPIGGITGETNDQAEYLRYARLLNGFLTITQLPVAKEFQNRLWAMRWGKRVVQVNSFLLLEGLRNAMAVIRDGQQHGDFTNWFNRLINTNVLVRVLPYGTTKWQMMRKLIYQDLVESAPNRALLPTIIQAVHNELNAQFPNYAPPALPAFVTLIPGTVIVQGPATQDLVNFDIPAFYHRIGTTDILDSRGHVVAVPNQVTVNGILVNTNVPNLVYYAASPTNANVRVAQVQHVGGLGAHAFGNLVQQMVNDTVGPGGLNTNVIPGAVGALIP